jgi:hypothetical protein
MLNTAPVTCRAVGQEVQRQRGGFLGGHQRSERDAREPALDVTADPARHAGDENGTTDETPWHLVGLDGHDARI